jgi:hypothetical protein
MNLNEFAASVKTIGQTNTILAQGEPGIGKSAVLKMIQKTMPEYECAYIDCTQLDLGDFALPYTEESEAGYKVTRFAPNARFKMHTGKKVVIMLDELGKAQRPVQNVLLTLMLEHRIGDVRLEEGSIVFATTNLASDGVGDKIEAHARNRMTVIKVEKPNSEAWREWGLFADIDPILLEFVKEFPQVLASYTTMAEGDVNPYIFNPRKQQVAFVTPRSLEAASHIIKRRDVLGAEVTNELLAGAVGAACAADMTTFIEFGNAMPSWSSIITKPKDAVVPDSIVVRSMTVHRAVQNMSVRHGTDDEMIADMNNWLVYLQRLDMELQAMFALSIMKTPGSIRLPWVAGNRTFVELVTKNSWVI